MTLRRIAYVSVLVLTLFAAACSPEAKKQKAMEGGNKYFERGQYKQARLMYLNAIKADPRFGEAYYKLALTNLRLGGYAEAVGNLERAVELQPENMDAHAKLSDIFLAAYIQNPVRNKGLLKDIRELAQKMDSRGKGSFEELRLRGYLLVADGKAEEALPVFREADKKNPHQVSLQLTIGRLLISLKRTDEAIALMNSMIEHDKTLGAAYDMLYGIYALSSKPEEAEQVFVRRLGNNPKDSSSRLRLAVHYFSLQKPEKMEKVLSEMIEKRSDFPNAYLEVGDFYYRIRDFDRAAATYEAGIKQDSAKARSYQKRMVEMRVAQNRAPEALEILEKLLKEDKADADAIAMRASLWLYAGKPEQINTAITELQSVVSKMPDNFVLRYNLGRALMAKGDLDSARVQLADSLKTRPDYLPARVALAQVAAARGEFAAALSAANEIIQIDPSNQYARLIQSHAYLSQGKYSDSKQVLEQTLKINPNQRDAKYQLGYVNFKEGKFKEAESYFQELYSATPSDIRGLMGLTEVYTATNQNERAMKLLETELQRYPKATALKIAWGNIAIRSKKFDEAVTMFQGILKEDPKNADMYMRIGEAYRGKGSLNEAIESWKKAGELMPNHTSPILFRAIALDEVNRRSEAAPLYEQVLKREPDNVMALNNYSYYLADQGNNLDLALTYAQKAKSRAPTDPMISDTLGFVYLKRNLPVNALSIFNELIAKYPNVSLFHIRQATAYLQQGNRDMARRALNEARRNKPSKTDQEEIQKLASKLG